MISILRIYDTKHCSYSEDAASHPLHVVYLLRTLYSTIHLHALRSFTRYRRSWGEELAIECQKASVKTRFVNRRRCLPHYDSWQKGSIPVGTVLPAGLGTAKTAFSRFAKTSLSSVAKLKLGYWRVPKVLGVSEDASVSSESLTQTRLRSARRRLLAKLQHRNAGMS